MDRWEAQRFNHAVVIRPVNDEVVHSTTDLCICLPAVKYEGHTCMCHGVPLGAVVKVITHNKVRKDK
jgi:hypothetical protein